MKKREVVCGIADDFSSGQVLPPSLEMLSPMPYLVRASSHREPSFRSTNMCSSNWRSFTGTLQPPRTVHVLPLSEEMTIWALLSCSRQFEIGSTHSPVD